ncbi:hypothetical protein QTI66_35665 [Variovorax sp. J22R133]|uniref:hypothetical protein n=1 Tax=Variovorax brevis TaxID=3053503 RepID=UPI0025788B21|nr:hypothetical protein [Variovorax sp. J22R133]MDM0117456.1 hypothetical protein [Variovorax sp. J22R133]
MKRDESVDVRCFKGLGEAHVLAGQTDRARYGNESGIDLIDGLRRDTSLAARGQTFLTPNSSASR